jgi:hypothetical protein
MAYAQSTTPRNWRGYRYFELLWEQIEEDTAPKTTLKKIECPLTKKTVRMEGTWAGATVTLYGSNKANPDETVAGDWFVLTDTAGASIAKTANGFSQCEDGCRWILPLSTAGGATQDIDVVVTAWPN